MTTNRPAARNRLIVVRTPTGIKRYTIHSTTASAAECVARAYAAQDAGCSPVQVAVVVSR